MQRIAKKGRNDETLKKGEQGLALAQKRKNDKDAAHCLNNVGNVYDSQGAYEKAAEYFQKSLKIYEEIGDKKGVSACLNNLGNVYKSQLARLNLPRWAIKGLLYISLVMTFEFFVLLFDPWNEKYPRACRYSK